MSKQAEELLSRFVLVLLRLRLHCFQEAFSTLQPYEEARDRPAETIVQKNQGAGQSTLNSQASRFVNDTKGKERARGNSRNRSRTAAKHNARVQMTSGERVCRRACFFGQGEFCTACSHFRFRVWPLAVWRRLYRRNVLHPPDMMRPDEASVHSYYAASRGFDRSQPRGKFRLQI
jgi:hypothetical protein